VLDACEVRRSGYFYRETFSAFYCTYAPALPKPLPGATIPMVGNGHGTDIQRPCNGPYNGRAVTIHRETLAALYCTWPPTDTETDRDAHRGAAGIGSRRVTVV
jgi:hypothetical protein